ncbi:unnamed protein product [Penicillium roqueforti FM164]|uniref:Uncharacterized protein n=1 Tax=Penicillium roqueforti (strain FM164) TaxID=1365484 RepID=W6QJS1_PENRF|nr:unnamed protein product [Penicillium roqueforti FM164]
MFGIKNSDEENIPHRSLQPRSFRSEDRGTTQLIVLPKES